MIRKRLHFSGSDVVVHMLYFVPFWYHLYNLENVKNTYGGVQLLVLKVTLLHGFFLRFLNCANGTKSRKASHICTINTILLLFKCIKPAEKIDKKNNNKN